MKRKKESLFKMDSQSRRSRIRGEGDGLSDENSVALLKANRKTKCDLNITRFGLSPPSYPSFGYDTCIRCLCIGNTRAHYDR